MNYLIDKVREISPYIVGGAMGAVIHRLRHKMSVWDFIKTIVISMFVSLCVGSLCRDYFNIESENLIFAICGMSGVFSKEILDEMREVISNLSEIVKRKFNKE